MTIDKESILIRPATPADIRERGEHGIRDLFNAVRRDERRQGRSPLAPPLYGSWASAMEKSSRYQILVAEKTGEIVGFCFAIHLKDKTSTTLEKLFTSPETHGVGRAFIAAVSTEAAMQGKTAITATAEAGTERASSFYQHLGFTVTSTETTAGGLKKDHLRLSIL